MFREENAMKIQKRNWFKFKRLLTSLEILPKRVDGRILLPSLLIFLWLFLYDLLLLQSNPIDSVSGFLNLITSLVTDAILLTAVGVGIFGFYLFFDLYFSIVTDPYSFSKLEMIWNEYREKPDLKRFFYQFTHLKEVLQPNSPIPTTISATLVVFGVYYLINLLGIIFVTEFIFLTLSGIGVAELSTENEIFLPLLAAAIPLGSRVSSIFGYKKAEEYSTMIAETLFLLALVGLLSIILQQSFQTFFLRLLEAEKKALGIFLALILYLSIIPLLVEIIFWALVEGKTDRI